MICQNPLALVLPFAVPTFLKLLSICPIAASDSTLIPACAAAACAASPYPVAARAAIAEPAGPLAVAFEAPGSCGVRPPPRPPRPAPELLGATVKLGAPRSW